MPSAQKKGKKKMEKMTFDQWWEKMGAWRYAEIMVQLPIALSARGIAAEAWEAAAREMVNPIPISVDVVTITAPADATPGEIAAALETPPAPSDGSDIYTPAPR
jgi:hypothetical protein